MDEIDRAAGVEHQCRRVLGMNVDPVEKVKQMAMQLTISTEDADVVLEWISRTEGDRMAQTIKRTQLFAESKTLKKLDVLPIQEIASEIDELNTAGRRLRGEFFLTQLESANTDISTILKSAMVKHVPQLNERQYLNMCQWMTIPEFRKTARQLYEIMTSERSD